MTSIRSLPPPPTAFDPHPHPSSMPSSSSSSSSILASRSPPTASSTPLSPAYLASISQTLPYPSLSTTFALDPSYSPVYSHFAHTGEVPNLLLDRENLSRMMHWLSRSTLPGRRKEEDTPAYADQHVSISAPSHRGERTLTVQHWLVAHPTLVVPLQDIVYILPAAQVVPAHGVSAWGVGTTGVGWARDLHRVERTTTTSGAGRDGGEGGVGGRRDRAAEGEQSYVCKFKGEGRVWYAGFTVERAGRFVEVLEGAWGGD